MAVAQYIIRVENLGADDKFPAEVKTHIINLIEQFKSDHEPVTIELHVDEISSMLNKKSETVMPFLQFMVELVYITKEEAYELKEELDVKLYESFNEWDNYNLEMSNRML